MSETYTLVGSTASWIVAFMPVPAVLAYTLVLRKNGQPTPFSWWQAAVIAYFFIAAIAKLPLEWIIAGACVGGSAIIFALKIIRVNRKMQILFGIYFLAMAAAFVYLGALPGERIVLTDNGADFTWFGRTDHVSRQGLRVEAIESKQWFNIYPWASWTSFSGNRIGPHLAGFSIYWGPSGLISGDQLGAHLATWAGVKPQFRSR